MPSIEAKSDKPIVVVVGIIQHPISHKILITERTDTQHLAGLWEFPGGKLEQSEGLFHTLQRELYEEVGITVQSAYPLKKIRHLYQERSVNLNFWVVRNYKGEAKPKEGQALEWVALSDISDYDFPEANEPILKSLTLPSFWMITPDCDLSQIDVYVQSIKQSIVAFNLKQVLFRSKNLKDDDYFLVHKKLEEICLEYGCSLILNRDKPDEKISQSWHLTSAQLYHYKKRPTKKGSLSASCHTIEDIRQSEKIGVDFILLSAVDKTSSHPEAKILGWYQFKKLAEQTVLPIFALGGVSREDISVARYHGAIGIAGISTFREHSELI